MMWTFILSLFLFGLVRSAPSDQSNTLDQKLKANICNFEFPSPVVTIPQDCAVIIPEKLKVSDDNIDVFLCLALLDIKNQICALRKDTPSILLKDINSFNVTQTLKDDKLCQSMATLSTNSSSAPVRTLFSKLHEESGCFQFCLDVDPEVSRIRKAMCGAIYQGHDIMHKIGSAKEYTHVGVLSNSEEIHPETELPGPSSLTSRQTIPKSQGYSNIPPQKQIMRTTLTKSVESHKAVGTPQNLPASKSPSVSSSLAVVQSSKGIEENHVSPQENQQEDKYLISPNGEEFPPGQNSAVPSVKLHTSVTDKHDQTNQNTKTPANNANSSPKDLKGDPVTQSETILDKEPGESSKGSVIPKKVSQVFTDKEEGNEAALDTPNTNIRDEMDEEDENVQDHLQGETDDEEETGFGDKKQMNVVKGSETLQSPAQQNSKPDDSVSKEYVGTLSSSQQYGYNGFVEAEDSHFFAYFMSLSVFFVICYLAYHNKRKIIAIAVEGKKGRNTGRRRPHSASYQKLDSNLEEAMSSNVTSTNSYVIY